ncbi:Leucine Rich Repeat [Seminavis robusta]|uniref:Leucine Rich Repeat n=1 Tax=Seminavis robusta TaxID=568900 RepID=A0A9N8E7H9_9STRA|nr:Leucine Rich Repeat [Seminavis robusta]|eukprot:Sro578_g169850.1 Leucine Rich Repeat (694) ;mRNA; f:44287-46701
MNQEAIDPAIAAAAALCLQEMDDRAEKLSCVDKTAYHPQPHHHAACLVLEDCNCGHGDQQGVVVPSNAPATSLSTSEMKNASAKVTMPLAVGSVSSCVGVPAGRGYTKNEKNNSVADISLSESQDNSIQPVILSRQDCINLSSLPGAYPVIGISSPRPELEEETSSSPGEDDFSVVHSVTGTERQLTSVEGQQSLPSAELVDIESAPEQMQQAVPAPNNGQLCAARGNSRKEPNRPRMLVIAAAILVLVVVAVAGTTVVAVEKQDCSGQDDETAISSQNASGGTDESQELQTTIDQYILTLLPSDTIGQIVAVDAPDQQASLDGTTPQAQAYQWLLQDPFVEAYSDQRLIQRFALAVFYFATEGSQWLESTHWLSHYHHECQWHFHDIIDEKRFDVAQYVDLPDPRVPCPVDGNGNSSENRTFEILEEVVFRHLWLHTNNLRGTLPRELYLLTNLHSVAAYSNRLEGTLATEIGYMTQLEFLSLNMNALSGTLPTELGLLSSLKGLFVFSNPRLKGSIPSELGLLHNIRFVMLWYCGLSGTVPAALGQATSLVELYLGHNRLTGTVATELGQLDALKRLALINNRLTGTVPTELGRLSNTFTLHLNRNSLSGTIPSELGMLSDMYGLNLDRNMLTGSIPKELGLLNHQDGNPFKVLNLTQNMLSGTVPEVLCTDMESMQFDCMEQLCGCECLC